MRKLLGKKGILLSSILVILTIIASSFAFYSSKGHTVNPLSTKGSGTYLDEVFNEQDHWLPGERKEKKVYFGNHGDADQVIRFKAESVWLKSDGKTVFTPDITGGEPVEEIWTDELKDRWVKIGDWYYYKQVLKSGSDMEKEPVLTGVAFSKHLTNDNHADVDYSKTIYKMVITMQSLNVSTEITKDQWGVNFTGTDSLTWS